MEVQGFVLDVCAEGHCNSIQADDPWTIVVLDPACIDYDYVHVHLQVLLFGITITHHLPHLLMFLHRMPVFLGKFISRGL